MPFGAELRRQTTEEEEEEKTFSSSLTSVLTTLGCLVTPMTLWRMPFLLAKTSDYKGCAVFLILWATFTLIWTCPMMILQLALGRYHNEGVLETFRKAIGNVFGWFGAFVSALTLSISAYMAVTTGWTLYYVTNVVSFGLPKDYAESLTIYKHFTEETYWSTFTFSIVVILTGLVVIGGISIIEKISLILVPTIFCLQCINLVWSLSQDYATHGIKLLFTADWNQFGNAEIWWDAISCSAVDSCIGLGVLITYSSYMRNDKAIVRYGTIMPLYGVFLTLISIMTTFAIMYASLHQRAKTPQTILQFEPNTWGFGYHLAEVTLVPNPSIADRDVLRALQDEGPLETGATFLWMPIVFGHFEETGTAFAILFYLGLALIGIVSHISMFELIVRGLSDLGIIRPVACILTIVITFSIGVGSTLRMDILLNQQFVWRHATMISAFMFQFIVLKIGANNFREVYVNDYGTHDWKLYKLWNFFVLGVLPVQSVGIVIYWLIKITKDTENKHEHWYTFTVTSLLIVIAEWLIMIILAIIVYLVVIILTTEETYDEPPPVYEPTMDEWASVYPQLFYGTYETGIQVNNDSRGNGNGHSGTEYPQRPPPYSVNKHSEENASNHVSLHDQ